MLIQQLAT